MRTLKIFDLKQANYLILNNAKVLSVNVQYSSGKTYLKFECDENFKKLISKWKNRQI